MTSIAKLSPTAANPGSGTDHFLNAGSPVAERPTPKPARPRREKRRRYASQSELEQAIGQLPDLARADLVERWEAAYGHAAPHKISRNLLVRSLAYKIQEDQYGGVAAATRRRLSRMADELRQRGDLTTVGHSSRIKPGTRFVREWQGTLHQVTVTLSGYEWQGRGHRSLSEIARAITGTRWNGWTFFGARSRPKRLARGVPNLLHPNRRTSPCRLPRIFVTRILHGARTNGHRWEKPHEGRDRSLRRRNR